MLIKVKLHKDGAGGGIRIKIKVVDDVEVRQLARLKRRCIAVEAEMKRGQTESHLITI